MEKLAIILLALSIDFGLGDPPNRFHPVVLMGHWLTLGRKNAPTRYRFWFGAGWILAGLGLFTLPFHLLRRLTSLFPIPYPLFTIIFSATLLKFVLAYRNLRRAVGEIMAALSVDDLPEARRLLSWHLVSRDTGQLSEAEVVGAAVESLAENVTDSLVAPLSAYVGADCPPPGFIAWSTRRRHVGLSHRGIIEQFGKFVARLDDALNWLPARLTG
jgi:adenosylcobinamide-phosphate synthase